MRGVVIGLAAVCWAGAAWAADAPVYAPAPSWVKPAAIPEPSASESQAAYQILLVDLQDRFGTDADEFYVATAMKLQTPQGLSGSNTNLSWNPETDTLIIHRLRLIRDSKSIDLLAGDRKFTVIRRESNLEMAMLDGRLSAIFQPEGVQVGDIVELAYTVRRKDPVAGGHSQRISGAPQGLPARYLRIRELWPNGKPIRWRETEGLDQPKVTKTADGSELLLEMRDARMPTAPKLAPARYGQIGQFEASDFASWSEVSALMSPLYARAAVLTPGSGLSQEAAKIKAAYADPKARAEAALRLVQDQVRYLFLGMNSGNYTPAAAEDTWNRRFGDCKGKTALLLALLKELGIEAEPALVSTTSGDGLDTRLPTFQLFDHVMVRASIGGRTYWMDGTRSDDRRLDEIQTPNFAWALPVRVKGAPLERLTVSPLATPSLTTRIEMDASGGLDTPAPVHIVTVARGDIATTMRQSLQTVAKADLDRTLKDYWLKRYDWAEAKTVSYAFDEATGEMKLLFDGTAKMDWSPDARGGQKYEADGASLGWKADFRRDSGPNRDAPYAVEFPAYETTDETIVLPHKGEGFAVEGGDVDRTIGRIEYKRTSKVENGVFRMHASTRAIAPEFPAAEAEGTAAALRELYNVGVYVRSPKTYVATATDMKALKDRPAGSATQYIERGYALQERADLKGAGEAYIKAAEVDPQNPLALADRGIAFLWQEQPDKAKADFDRALKLDPRQSVAWRGLGSLHSDAGRYKEAVEAYSKALEVDAADANSLLERAKARTELKDYDAALADLEDYHRLEPAETSVYNYRAGIYLMKGKTTHALAEAEDLVEAAPKSADSHLVHAMVLAAASRREEARKAYADSLAITPSAAAYLGRARTTDDNDKALADLDQALKLDPKLVEALWVRAGIYVDRKNDVAALADLDAAARLDPKDPDVLMARSHIYQRQLRWDAALKDADRFIELEPGNAMLLNERCWARAIAGKLLEGALADCDAALKANPKLPAAWDSRGMVNLKLGRLEASIADYDAALKLRDGLAASLYGRGIAKIRKGDRAGGQHDIADARKADPNIDKEFAGYQVRADQEVASSS